MILHFRLVASLPKPNQVLLKLLISLLNRIASSCDMNLMTPYNLSVCLGPCLLWTKSSACADLEQASKTVQKLLQFMLENSEEIFGLDIKLLLHQQLTSKVSRSLDSVLADSMPRSRTSHQRLSIDSLDSIDGRCDIIKRHQSPSSLSRDSGLIINDCAFEEEEDNDEQNTSRPRSRIVTVSYESIDSQLLDMESGSTNNLTPNLKSPGSHSTHLLSKVDRLEKYGRRNLQPSMDHPPSPETMDLHPKADQSQRS